MPKVEVQIVGNDRSLQAALGRSSGGLAGFAGRAARVGGRIARDLTFPVAAAGAASVKMALDFDTSINHVQALTGASQKQTKEWADQILNLAPKIGQTPKQLADALYFVASSGAKVNEVLPITAASAKAAASGMGDAQTVAQLLTSAINAYGAKALSASKATDILTEAVKVGKAEPSDLAANLGKVIPVAQAMGVSFAEVTAATSELTNTGLDAAQAATGVRAVLTGLIKPASQTADEFKTLGLSVGGVQTEIRDKGLLATLDDLKTRVGDNKTAMGKLFPNVRALTAFLALTGKNSRNAAKALDQVEHSTGAADKAFRIASAGPGQQLNRLLAQLEAIGIRVGNDVLPTLLNVAGLIGKIAASPNITTAIKVTFRGIEAGAKSIAEAVQHALFGSSQTLTLRMPTGRILGITTKTSQGIVDQLESALKTADWSEIGKQIGSGIGKSIRFTANTANSVVTGLVSAINANRGAIAAAGVGIVATMFTTVLDPEFWIKNWRLALDVAVAALTVAFTPAKLLEPLRALPFARFIITPLEKLGRPLRAVVETLGRGIVRGLRDVFPEATGAAERISTGILGRLRSIPGRGLAIIEEFGRFIGRELANTARQSGVEAVRIGSRIVDGLDRFIGAVGNVASRLVGRIITPFESLAGRIAGPVLRAMRVVVNAVGGIIGRVFSTGAAVGRSIMEGIASGLDSLIGWLEGKISGIASGLLDKAKGILHISSPSKVFADQVGVPIAQGIAMGITKGSRHIDGALSSAVLGGRGMTLGVAGGAGGGRMVIEVPVYLNGHEIARALREVDKDYRRQNGGRPLLSGS